MNEASATTAFALEADNCAITVAICTYDRYDILPRAITSCLSQRLTGNKSYDIMVVDNTPDCETRQEFFETYQDQEGVQYIVEDIAGLSRARNIALEASKSEFIVYLDDDAIASDGWLEEILAGFEFLDDVGIVGGRIDPVWEGGRPKWLPREVEGMFSVVDWDGEMRLAAANEWFAGANIAFRCDILKNVGGFNTKLGRVGSGSSLLSNEESAAVDAIEELNYRRVYAPNAVVGHHVGKERLTRAWLRRRQAWQAVSDFQSGGKKSNSEIEAYWHGVSVFMNSIPPRYRTQAGLFRDFDDPEITNKQIGAVYCMVALMLVGATDVDDVLIRV